MKISELPDSRVFDNFGNCITFEKGGVIYQRCFNCGCYHDEDKMQNTGKHYYCMDCIEELPVCGICNCIIEHSMDDIYIYDKDMHLCINCIDEYQEMVWELKNREMGEI